MKRFYFVMSALMACAALFLFQRAAGTDWVPAAPWDVLGILWLLSNFPKLVVWLGAWMLATLSLFSLVKGLQAPSGRSQLESEQKRLLAHMILNAPPPDAGEPEPPGRTPGTG